MKAAWLAPSALRGTLVAPPSKSYTHRALVAGYLSHRTFRVENPLYSDDTAATARGLGRLGASVDRTPGVWTIRPKRPEPHPRREVIECRESGTTLRFLLPVAACRTVPVRFVGSPRLRARPFRSLTDALRAGGARVTGSRSARTIATVTGPLQGLETTVDVSESSQFLSALLMVLPTLDQPSTLRLRSNPVSRPYLEATIRVLRASGVRLEWEGRVIRIRAPQRYRGSRFRVPGDASSAAYLWAGAAVSGGAVTVEGIDRRWPQADLAILDILEAMGAVVRRHRTAVAVAGPLNAPVRVNLDNAPDLLPLVSVLAATVPKTSRLTGARHAARKESDRRAESARLARKLGATVRLRANVIEILGGPTVRPLRFSGPADHRMVMSAAVASLAGSSPSVVRPAGAVAKSYPGFWQALRSLGAEVRIR